MAWAFENYLSFAFLVLLVSFILTLLNYFLLIIGLKKLKKLAKLSQDVRVLRSHTTRTIPSRELVPGDLITIENKQTVPCDCVLLQGDLYMNESSLTGETIPIQKTPISPHSESLFNPALHKRSYLFEGTKVLQVRQTTPVLALVLRTGYLSFKGQIMRSVLYPKPIKFPFYGYAIKFEIEMLVIVIAIYFAFLYSMINTIELPTRFIVFRFFDAVTWIIPAFLPIFMSICISLALSRLRLSEILVFDPQKTFLAGKITHMCFDKTGTLTNPGVDVYGYHPIEGSSFSVGISLYKFD